MRRDVCTIAGVFFVGLAFVSSAPNSWAGSWTPRTISSQDLFDISFPTAGVGWVVGKSGTILKSINSGQTWSAQTSGSGSDLAGVDFVDASHGCAVGAGDTVLYTSNGGLTWTASSTGTGANLSDVDFVDPNNGWAVGSKLFLVNAVAHTSDGGATWTEQNAPAGIGLVSVSFADQQHGFTGGFEDVAYRTEDGGQTWITMAVESNGGNGDSFYAVRRLNAKEGLIGGFKGNIYRTQDGGVTWAVVASFGKPIRALAVSGTSAFAVGDGGFIARSEDSGGSWELEASSTLFDLKGIAAPSAASAFAVGAGGTLVEFKAGTTVAIPLDVSPLSESCDILTIAWKHDAAGTVVAAATGDLDGNGNQEIVIAGPSGLRALHPFDGTEQATLWSLPFQTRFQQVMFAELDGNSATKEVVAATAASGISRSGVLAVKGATGEVLWSRQIPGGSRAVRVADFNKDGFDDVVSIGDGRTLSWLDGRDGSDLYPAQALNAVGTDLEIGDLNNDGVPEVVVTLSDGKVMALNGATGGVLWTYQSQAGDPGGGFGGLRAVVLGDLNGDGVPDIVAVGEGTSSSLVPGNGDCSNLTIGTTKGALIVALNGPDGTLRWDYAEPGSDMFTAVSLGDFNGDGVPDVVAHASTIGSGHLVALDGRGITVNGVPTGDAQTLWSFDTTRGADTSQFASSPEAIAVGDGNGDGTPDVYVALYDGYLIGVSGSIPASTNPRCAPPATELWEVLRNGTVYYDSFTTINNQPFVLALSGGDNLVALRNPATGEVAWPYDTGGEPLLVAGDLDGDGLPEIGVGTVSGRIYGLNGDGSPLSLNDNFFPHAIVGLVSAPVLGGSTRELVGASSDGTVRAVNPRTGQQIWERTITEAATAIAEGSGVIAVGTSTGSLVGLDVQTGAVKWESPGTANINALAFSPDSNLFAAGDSNGDVRFFNSMGEVQNTYPTATASFQGVHAIALADVDGDGINEFAVAAGQTFFVLHADGSFLWRYDVPGAGLAVASHVAPVDLDGDGGQEIVGATNGGGGRAYALAGRTGNLLWSIDNGIPGGIAAMDINGDGKQEALLGTESLGFPLGNGTLRAVNGNGSIVATCALRQSPHTIVVGNFDGTGTPQAAVGMAEGDVYLLKAPGPSPTPVQLVSAVSRKTHNFAGQFDIDLKPPAPGIECRAGGATGDHTVVVTFALPVTVIGNGTVKAQVTSGTGQVGTGGTANGNAVTVSGAVVTVPLTNVANAQRLSITIFGVSDGTNSGNVVVPMSVLLGDTSASGLVNSTDISQTQAQSGQAVTKDNFRTDINANGLINSTDVSIVQSKSGTGLPPP